MNAVQAALAAARCVLYVCCSHSPHCHYCSTSRCAVSLCYREQCQFACWQPPQTAFISGCPRRSARINGLPVSQKQPITPPNTATGCTARHARIRASLVAPHRSTSSHNSHIVFAACAAAAIAATARSRSLHALCPQRVIVADSERLISVFGRATSCRPLYSPPSCRSHLLLCRPRSHTCEPPTAHTSPSVFV